MNERIKELAVQAHAKDNTLHYYNPEFIEKFAELIIKECISQAHSVAELRGANEDMIYGADTAAGRIAKHFGVES